MDSPKLRYQEKIPKDRPNSTQGTPQAARAIKEYDKTSNKECLNQGIDKWDGCSLLSFAQASLFLHKLLADEIRSPIAEGIRVEGRDQL